MAMADPSPRCGFIHQILGGLILAMDSNGENYSLIWVSYGFIIWNPPFHSPKHHVMPLITEKSPKSNPLQNMTQHPWKYQNPHGISWWHPHFPSFSLVKSSEICSSHGRPRATPCCLQAPSSSGACAPGRSAAWWPDPRGTAQSTWRQCLVNFQFRNQEPWLDEENDDKWWYYSMMIIIFWIFLDYDRDDDWFASSSIFDTSVQSSSGSICSLSLHIFMLFLKSQICW